VSPTTRVPIACSLTPSELRDRGASFRTLAAAHLVRATRTPDGATLEFRDADGTVEPAVRELARAEKACCPFFEFSITSEAGVVRLEVSAPEDGQAFVDAIIHAVGSAAPSCC
jgi:hypothetical protein